jgi:hypothetical protein
MGMFPNVKTVEISNRSMVVVTFADTKSTGRSFQVMAESRVGKIPPGLKLANVTVSFQDLVLLPPYGLDESQI